MGFDDPQRFLVPRGCSPLLRQIKITASWRRRPQLGTPEMAAALQPVPLFKVFVAPPEELDAPLLDVLHSGYITQGKKVEEFEEWLRHFFGHSRVLTLNSGTSGLHLALHLLLKPDPDSSWPGLVENVDEVLTCPLTCTATNWPIVANRLRIKWVDADPGTCTMCMDDLERKLSPTT